MRKSFTVNINPKLEFEGVLISFSANMLSGWVQCIDMPEQRWAVSIQADNTPLSLVMADQFHPQAPGDGCHGFRVMLHDEQIQGAHKLQLCLANSDTVLDSLTLPATKSYYHNYDTSQVQHLPGLMLTGWLTSNRTSEEKLNVCVYKDNQLICETVPSQWLNISNSYTKAVFTVHLPIWLADGEPHILTVKDNKGRELAGSPIRIQEWPQGLSACLKQLENKLTTKEYKMLHQQADRYERTLPRSVRMLDYDAWLQAFGPITKKKSGGKNKDDEQPLYQPTLAILWLGGCPVHPPKCTQAQVEHIEVHSQQEYGQLLSQALTSADWITQLRCNDILIDDAIDKAIKEVKKYSSPLLYSDFDYPDKQLNSSQPKRTPAFLPSFDPDRLWCQDYLEASFCLFNSQLFKEQTSLLPAKASNLSYALLTALKGKEEQVLHLPEVLLHRHAPWPTRLDIKTIEDRQSYLSKYDSAACILPHPELKHIASLKRELEKWPDVTLVIPTRDGLALLKRCIDTLFEHTDYPGRVRILIMDNQSSQLETIDFFTSQQALGERSLGRGTGWIDIQSYPHPFNYASINNAGVKNSTSEVIGLLNNDIEILHPEWLCNMVSLLMRPDTGIVGAKLLWPNGMVQHGGVIGGQFDGLAGHVGNHWHNKDEGYLTNNHLTQRFSIVTAACLLIRRSDYNAIAGLDERAYPVGFNDVDLCLKIRALGKAVIWTPEAKLIHAESASRGKDESPEQVARAQREMNNLRQQWGFVLNRDPAYNPNLSLDQANAPFTELAMPPRAQKARNNRLPVDNLYLQQNNDSQENKR